MSIGVLTDEVIADLCARLTAARRNWVSVDLSQVELAALLDERVSNREEIARLRSLEASGRYLIDIHGDRAKIAEARVAELETEVKAWEDTAPAEEARLVARVRALQIELAPHVVDRVSDDDGGESWVCSLCTSRWPVENGTEGHEVGCLLGVSQ